MIAIIDYGAGNLRSVQNAFAAAGAETQRVTTVEEVRRAGKLVLPGVGHFGQMMRTLDELSLRVAIRERIEAGAFFLGVCLGLQALFTESAEAPGVAGLGIFRGRIERFPNEMRVPHMGWNRVVPALDSRLLGDGADRHFYFAHSFYAPAIEETSAVCAYSRPFCAAVERGNCFGVQFHPEKSGPDGLEILRRFANL